MNNRKIQSQNILAFYVCEEMCNSNHPPSNYYLIRVREIALSGLKPRVQSPVPRGSWFEACIIYTVALLFKPLLVLLWILDIVAWPASHSWSLSVYYSYNRLHKPAKYETGHSSTQLCNDFQSHLKKKKKKSRTIHKL